MVINLDGLDIIGLSLALTGIMLLATLIINTTVVVVRGRKISLEGDEMYIGGESEVVLEHKIPSVLALYWGIVKRSWRKAFEILRDSIHTGVLNDWLGYMSMWFGLILFMALIVVAIYMFMW